jgi:hypothetical protein
MKTNSLFGLVGLMALGGMLVGCGEDVPVPDFKSGQGETAVPETAYPEGPYGFSVGSIVPNLKFIGFHNPQLNADTNNMEAIDLSQFYNPTGSETWAADSTYRPGEAKPKALWIDVSAQWCVPCQNESKSVLPGDYAKYQPLGAEFMLELIENTNGDNAQPVNLVQWTTKYKTAWPAIIDPERQAETLFHEDAYPNNILIDTKTMTVVQSVAGAPPSHEDCAALPSTQCVSGSGSACEVASGACKSVFFDALDGLVGVAN